LLANSYLMRHQTRVAKFANTLKGNLKWKKFINRSKYPDCMEQTLLTLY
jgi:hypothetical protein